MALGFLPLHIAITFPARTLPTHAVIFMCDSLGLNSRLGYDSLQAERFCQYERAMGQHVSEKLSRLHQTQAQDILVCVRTTT